MKYDVEIIIKDNPDLIYKCFLTEISKRKRSSFNIAREKNKLRFSIKAEDVTALKATLNSITQLLTVYEKIKGMKNA